MSLQKADPKPPAWRGRATIPGRRRAIPSSLPRRDQSASAVSAHQLVRAIGEAGARRRVVVDGLWEDRAQRRDRAGVDDADRTLGLGQPVEQRQGVVQVHRSRKLGASFRRSARNRRQVDDEPRQRRERRVQHLGQVALDAPDLRRSMAEVDIDQRHRPVCGGGTAQQALRQRPPDESACAGDQDRLIAHDLFQPPQAERRRFALSVPLGRSNSGLSEDPGGDQGVDAVERLGRKLEVAGGEGGLQMLHGARADDRGGDRRVFDGEGDRQLGQGDARSLRQLGEFADDLQLAPDDVRVRIEPAVEHLGEVDDAAVVGEILGLAVAARQETAVERAPHDHAHAVAAAGRQHEPFDVAVEDRIGALLAPERLMAAAVRRPLRLDDAVGREHRGAEVADLALADELGEGEQHLVDVGRGVETVHLVEVDVVDPQPAQAVLDGLDDPAARAAALVRILAHHIPEFRGEDHVLTAALEGAADDLLRYAAGIDVRRVDEVDPGVERAVDDAHARVPVRIAHRPEHHRPEAQARHPHARLAQHPHVHLAALALFLSRGVVAMKPLRFESGLPSPDASGSRADTAVFAMA